MIHIAFISDDAYMFATGVAVSSIKRNRTLGTAYTIHVLCDRVSATKKEKLMRLRNADFEIDIVDVSGLADISVFFMKGFPVSPSAIYKFKLPQIFHGLNRIIYMDGDLVVRGDLTSLWEQDLDGFYVAAVSDRHAHFFKHKTLSERIGYPHADYFNSGVMLLNLELMRKDCITEKLFDYRLNGRNDFMDQDALNVVLGVHARFLPLRFNTIATCVRYSDAEHLNRYYPDTHVSSREEACSSALIYHYASGAKPWKFANCDNRDVWLAEWRRSIYADEPIGNDVFAPEEERHRLDMQVVAARPVKVSVIIPVYNAQKYLEECIQSVLNQKGIPELEVICVDDGSVDNSIFVAYGRQFRDARVRVVSQRNAGPGVARNAGIDAARGEYICFLDADDRLSSGAALREAYRQAKADDLDILLAKGSIMLENGKVEKRDVYFMDKIPLPDHVFAPVDVGANLYLVTLMGPEGKLFRRKFLEEQDVRFPALKRSEDFPFIQLMLSLARRIGVCPRSMFDRRIGVATSLESTKDETPLVFVEAERIFRKELDRRGLSGKYKDAANAAFTVRLAYNLRAVRMFASYKAIFDETRELFAAWTSCGDGDGIPEDCRKAKAYLDGVFVAHASDLDLMQRFTADCAARIRGEVRHRVEQLERERNMLKSALQESQRARGKVWAEREAMKAAMLAAKTELAEAQKRRGEVWAEREAMKAELLAAKSELAAAQKRRGEVWAEREAMKAELLAAKSELAAAQKRRGKVWAEREAMKAELLAAKSELAAAQKRRGEVWAERCTLSAQVLGLKKKLDEIDRITG